MQAIQKSNQYIYLTEQRNQFWETNHIRQIFSKPNNDDKLTFLNGKNKLGYKFSHKIACMLDPKTHKIWYIIIIHNNT